MLTPSTSVPNPAYVYYLSFITCYLLSTSITALVISSHHENDQCMEECSGIFFAYGIWIEITYANWLKIYGITEIYTMGVCLFLFIWWRHMRDDCLMCLGYTVAILGYAFQFVWYIIGAILYFKTVISSCPSGQPLHDFGLALFIIQTITHNIVFLLMAYFVFSPQDSMG